MKAIAILLLLACISSLCADEQRTDRMVYDPLAIFDDELEAGQRLKYGGSISFNTGLALSLAGSITLGVGYLLLINYGDDKNGNSTIIGGITGTSVGLSLSLSGIIAWFVGNKRAFDTLRSKSTYLHITSGL